MVKRRKTQAVVFLILFGFQFHANAKDSKPSFNFASGFVSASGRWMSTSGKPEDELAWKHAVKIQCRLDIKECYEAIAEIIAGEPHVDVINYSVIAWDKNTIIAEDNAPICTTNRLLINFQDQSVMAIDTPKKGAKGMPLGNGKDACESMSRTRTFELVSSLK